MSATRRDIYSDSVVTLAGYFSLCYRKYQQDQTNGFILCTHNDQIRTQRSQVRITAGDLLETVSLLMIKFFC